jgi:hypothetical protein
MLPFIPEAEYDGLRCIPRMSVEQACIRQLCSDPVRSE